MKVRINENGSFDILSDSGIIVQRNVKVDRVKPLVPVEAKVYTSTKGKETPKPTFEAGEELLDDTPLFLV